jgi:2-keto-4-pentenoate hydratase/2-oxohepta-3-ene-1,7-dioic acid hydratase in catechol pathway
MTTRLPGHAGPFALATLVEDGREFPGLVSGDRVRDLSERFGGVNDLLADWDANFELLTGLADDDLASWRPLAGLDFRPPLRPGQVLQSGANYKKHVVDIVLAEYQAARAAGLDDRPEEAARAEGQAMMDARAEHGSPYVFIGLPGAICGPYDDVVLPAHGVEHDWELELAVVVGRAARDVAREDALAHVAGYTICNDLTTRDRVYRPDLAKIGTDWFAAKNSPTFLPTGPYLVPAAFAGDPMDLRITLRHNGEVRQDESTKDMIFDIPALISYVSRIVPLSPGDLLLTGSPAGNGTHWGERLVPGSVMDSEITGLGHQRNLCIKEQR